MQRLIEQPTGDGEIRLEGRALGRVHYHLSVYQRFSGNDNEPVPASLEIEGRIIPSDPLQLAALRQAGPELTLQLTDGRALTFSITDGEGRIRSTGRGLFTQSIGDASGPNEARPTC